MTTEQRVTPRRIPLHERDEEFDQKLTSDQLASVLQEASSLESEERRKGRALNSLDDALATARELGIEERHVHAAASRVRAHRERLGALRTITRRRRSRVVAFAGLMLAISFGVAMSADTEAGLAVLLGMFIALLIMTAKWFQAWLEQKYPETFEFESERGECRICGARAAEKRGFHCTDHQSF